MGQWEILPADLLIEIYKLLILYADKVRFACVCKSWKSALPRMPPHQLPWLLQPCCVAIDQPSFGLFNLLDKKDYFLDLPKTEKMVIRGSSHGWVVVLEQPDDIYLMNPLTRAKIQLPPRSKFPDVKEYCADKHDHEYVLWNKNGVGSYSDSSTHVHLMLSLKFTISSNPSLADDYVVVAIYGEYRRLAYCQRGDERWTQLLGQYYDDAIFHDGKLHALRYGGELEVIDIRLHQRTEKIAKEYIVSGKGPFVDADLYLVVSSSGLLLVSRQLAPTSPDGPNRKSLLKTYNFFVFKLDLTRSEWCRVTYIGDDVIFIGPNTSASKSSLEFPGLKRNCIYFTADHWHFNKYEGIPVDTEIGVFDLNNKRFEPLPGYKCGYDLVWPPPIWFIPTPTPYIVQHRKPFVP